MSIGQITNNFVYTLYYKKIMVTPSPMTNEGLLRKSAHVILVPCSDIIG